VVVGVAGGLFLRLRRIDFFLFVLFAHGSILSGLLMARADSPMVTF
jgi:hypothetical protein